MANKKFNQYDEDELYQLWHQDEASDKNPNIAQRGSMWRVIARSTQGRVIWRVAMAAAVALFVTCGIAFWWAQPKDTAAAVNLLSVKTSEASKTVLLPDSSTVILGVHSSIEYPASFEKTDRRQVLLVGEALFKVKHTGQGFVVTAAGVETEVLGTVFKVKASTAFSTQEVALYEGKVRVGETGKSSNILKPGDRWLLESKTGKTAIQHAQANILDVQLTFRNTSVDEAIEQIAALYHVKIVNSLPQEVPEISGTFYYSSAQQSLEELAFPFGLIINKINENTYEVTKSE